MDTERLNLLFERCWSLFAEFKDEGYTDSPVVYCVKNYAGTFRHSDGRVALDAAIMLYTTGQLPESFTGFTPLSN